MTIVRRVAGIVLPVFLVAVALAAGPDRAQAAGAAYAVDTAEVTEPGSCKVESWVSSASNHVFFAAVAPACVVDVFRPTELNVQFSRSRADSEWATAATPKIKTSLMPTGIGTWGVAASVTASYDLGSSENTALAFAVPATLRLSETARINLNGGWHWDRLADRHYFTYGAGFDVRTPDNVYILTAEIFGQTGTAEVSTVVRPRFQTGLRYRPVDRFSVDLIYGRNIAGENANWLTLATIVRFPPPGK